MNNVGKVSDKIRGRVPLVFVSGLSLCPRRPVGHIGTFYHVLTQQLLLLGEVPSAHLC